MRTSPDRSTRGPLARALRGLGLSAAVLAGSLLALELALRLRGDVQPAALVLHETFGQVLNPGWDGLLHDSEVGRAVRLRVDRHGFRTPDRPFEKPPGTLRVAVLGDSMVAGLAMDEEDTLTARLEAGLRAARPGSRWEVFNFGVPAWGTGPQALLHRELVRRYAPDLVLSVFFVGNDLSDNGASDQRLRKVYFDVDADGELAPRPFPSLGQRVRDWLDRHSRLYVWQKRLGARVGGPARRTPPRRAEPVYATLERPEVAAAWRVTRAALRTLARQCAADGSAFAVVLLPASAQVHAEEFAAQAAAPGAPGAALDAEHPGRRLAAICADLGVPFVDLLPAFRAAAPSRSEQVPEEWLFLHGFGHLNARGHALVAAELAARVPALLAGAPAASSTPARGGAPDAGG